MKGRISILDRIKSSQERGEKQFALLIDPDKTNQTNLIRLIDHAEIAEIDYYFVGGSLLNQDQLGDTIRIIKKNSQIPIVLFPGSPLQIHKDADALLFLSLISGRNPELLIGNHVIAAPYIMATELEVLPTGYMLIDSGRPTTASYISNSIPIPRDKPDIAACTALAGEYLGLKLMYLDGGSGAKECLSEEMIREVRDAISGPLIVGGGIDNADKARRAYEAGADVIVVGNALEKNPELLPGLSAVRSTFRSNQISNP